MQSSKISFYLAVVFALCTTMLAYGFSINIPEYVDDSAVLFQAHNIKDIPFDFLEWVQLRYVGLKSFYISNLFDGDLKVVHLVSIAIHLINGLLVFFILRLLRFSQWSSLAITAIWLIHPLNSQAVVYMSQRFTLVATLWLLLTLFVLLFLQTKIQQSKCKNNAQFVFKTLLLLFLACVCFLLSVLSKQSAAFLPLFIGCYFLFFSNHKKLMTIITVVLFGIFSLLAYLYPEVVHQLDSLTRETVTYTRLDYFATQLKVIFIYFYKLILPINLSLESGVELVKFGSSTFYGYALAHLLLIGLVFILHKRQKDTKLLLALTFFYFSMIVESSLIPIQDLYFEHRMYLPSAAAIVVIYYLFYSMFGWLVNSQLKKQCVFGLLFLVLAVMTFSRVQLWQDPYTFYANEYKQNPNSTRAMSSYGKELAKRGEKKKALELLLRSYNAEIKQGIMRQSNIVGLLTVLIDLKYYQDALNLGRRAIKLTKSRPKLQAIVYAHLALVYYEMNECGFATGWSKRSLSLDKSVGLAQQLIMLCEKRND